MKNIIKKKILLIDKRLHKIENFFLKKKKIEKKSVFIEYSKLTKIKNLFNIWNTYCEELKDVQLLLNDNELSILVKEEIKTLNYLIKESFNKLKNSISSHFKDKKDNLNAYLEIKAGTGGHEAALFALDLFKMYVKYAESIHYKVELININSTPYGGYKEITFKIIGKNAYGKLKFESGGHRVQRVPLTESQGRVHTSTCTVAVIPDIPSIKLPVIKNEDIKINTFKSSGSGGQHVNTTDSAVRITHIPTGLVVECQQERSQHKNKSKALTILKSRIYSLEIEKRHLKKSYEKKILLGTGFRCDRNRTYNFSQNRITDHRINYTIYSLSEILNGNLNLLIDPIINYFN